MCNSSSRSMTFALTLLAALLAILASL
ncbi:MAG: hypothetical protein DRJ96_01265 [Thermoprotei archaeon]|nr:MAG: hypothetical protein DRJ67_00150 [Thermoprotei archaeon]RLE98377.1 MAG: hypothetical protein DRJ96_01265 [Thermoprotei archaeon]